MFKSVLNQRIMIRLLIPVLMSTSLLAQEPSKEAPATVKPVIKEINADELQIGKIHLNKKTREISFDAGLNMNEGLLEYVLVMTKGKVHESLFLTDISPINLNIALKLLRYQESQELFEIMDADFNLTGKYPDVPEAQRQASRIDIHVSWKEGGAQKTFAMNKLIYHIVTETTMQPGPWLNTGSYMHEGKYKAEVAGDLIAIYTSQPAMLNYPGKDRSNDDVWIPNKKLLPKLESVVTITLKPYTP